MYYIFVVQLMFDLRNKTRAKKYGFAVTPLA